MPDAATDNPDLRKNCGSSMAAALRMCAIMDLLGVFAKYWQAGHVKTRLAAEIGSQVAAELQRLFLATLLRRLEPLGFRKQLAFTPVDRRDEFAELAGPAWELTPQSPGDLGQRMRGFFEAGFEAGAQRVVILGSDSPSLPKQFVLDAFEQLGDRSVVLGPCPDGGYYLLGLAATRALPPILDEIPWGTSETWSRTVRRLRSGGVDFATAPDWYDVDRLADLQRLHAELRNRKRLDTPLAELLAGVGQILV
jgi:rSAM/selenodomain-associated transferase 1